jgi:hypothetical protein
LLVAGKENATRNLIEPAGDTTPAPVEGSKVDAIQDSEYFRSLYTLTLSLRQVKEHHGHKCEEALPSKTSISEPKEAEEDLPRPVVITYISVISPPVQSDELP